MDKAKSSAIVALVLGILTLGFAGGRSLIEWEWWDFLLILSSMALIVAVVIFLVQIILQTARQRRTL